MTIPTAAITAPTDRSMFRVTMISTIPVAMIATTAVWTDRFHRFLGVRNVWRRSDDLEDDPDDRQRDEHPGEPGVDLGRPQRSRGTSAPPLLRLRGLRLRRALGRGDLGLSHRSESYADRAAPRSHPPGGARASGHEVVRPDRSAADRHAARLDALAQLVHRDPPRVDHDVEVVRRDRDRRRAGSTSSGSRPGSRTMTVPGTSASAVPCASATAASPAALPSSRASFQTDTVCVPRATRFRAARSPSWPDTATSPARPWASSAATTPPAIPSLDATTACDVVVVLRQELLHVRLRDRRVPVVRVGLADVHDVTRVERVLEDLLLAGAQEVGVRRRPSCP